MTQYFWKIPTVPIDAEIAGKEMERVRSENEGVLTAENLLDASRAEEAPLHSCFEWRDHVAAEKYRLRQSGNMIRNIEIVVTSEPVKKQAPVYVNVSAGNATARYKPLQVTTAGEREVVLKNAYRDFNAYKSRYHELLTEIAPNGTETMIQEFEEALRD